LEPIFWSR